MIIRGNLNKALFSIGIAIFLVISLFGALHMGMSSGSSMDNCPFAAPSSVCTMAPLEHIGAAQNFLNTLPSQKDAVYFLLLVISGVLLFASYFLKLFSPPKLSPAYCRTYNNRSQYSPNFLQEAFSRGILNSKTF
jgi:hypothetical protein